MEKNNEQLNNESEFEIVHTSLRRHSESKGEQIFETEHFIAIAKGYIVEKHTPAVSANKIDIPDITFEQYKPQVIKPEDDDVETEITSFRRSEVQDNETEPISEDISDFDDVVIVEQSYQKKSKILKIVSRICLFVGAFATVFLAIVFFNVYVHRKNVVYGSSMEPTLYENDVVYTTKLSYFFGEPKVGDIVVIDIDLQKETGFFYVVGDILKHNAITDIFRSDEEKNKKADTCWIKRVVAVAGDYVEFKDNKFYRNGQLVEEDYLKSQHVMNYPETSFVVEEGTVFCMGDNRNVSKDSRNVGAIPVYQIIGKVWKM